MKKLIVLLLSSTLATMAYATNDLQANVKEPICTSSAPNPIGTYSQAIKVGKTVHISGQIPIDPATGKLVEGDFEAQARRVFKNLSAITQAAGGNLDNIAKLNVYLTDLNDFATLNALMGKYFTKPYPARVVVGAKDLLKNATIEIDAVMQK